MSRKLHLHTITTRHDHDPFDPAAPVSVPLGGGLSATVRDGERTVTIADLRGLTTSASLLWQEAAAAMLATLGELTSTHGTALRHRTVGEGVREIAVIGTPFPAAGLLAHPLLALPTHRILSTSVSPTVFFTDADQRLYVSPGQAPGVSCAGPIDVSAGHCQALESVP